MIKITTIAYWRDERINRGVMIPNLESMNPKLAQRKLFTDDRMFHLMGEASLDSNGSDGQFMLANTRWKATILWHLGYHDIHRYD